ncbi:hypothetical protein BKA63DRAFT_512123 [Paraphoma chrysanthemicola]|nr:hypothetical protein BKA63DRAFT_512123 [Paraphoma chrysanthemicola]
MSTWTYLLHCSGWLQGFLQGSFSLIPAPLRTKLPVASSPSHCKNGEEGTFYTPTWCGSSTWGIFLSPNHFSSQSNANFIPRRLTSTPISHFQPGGGRKQITLVSRHAHRCAPTEARRRCHLVMPFARSHNDCNLEICHKG